MAGPLNWSQVDIGRSVYATALAALGALSIASGDFAYVWQPVPAWVPGRSTLAIAFGAVLVVASVGVLVRWARARATVLLMVTVTAWLLVLHAPRVVAEPSRVVRWSGFGEIAMLVAGATLLLAQSADPVAGRGRHAGERLLRWGRGLLGVAIPLVGLSHFFYADATAEMVPAWLPARLGWAYLTGVGHVAAGIAIVLGIVPRLAATLEVIMISAFVLLVHVPGVISAPRDRLQWTMLLMAAAMAGATGIVARSYRNRAPELLGV